MHSLFYRAQQCTQQTPSRPEITLQQESTSIEKITVARYLVLRLKELQVDHIWALCGDYIGEFMDDVIDEGSIQLHYPSTEQEGGYSANAYALTTKKPGLIAVTYGVGAFNALNAASTGWVAMNPMIILNGSPSQKQFQANRHQGILYHHMMEQGRFQERDIFKHVTSEAFIINNPELARQQIDTALVSAITYNTPVYLEFEASVYTQKVLPPSSPLVRGTITSIPTDLEGAVNYTIEVLKKSKKPLIWQGAEIIRYNAEEEFKEFLALYKIPYVSSIDGKGAISELNQPLFQGVFAGQFTDSKVIDLVKESDFLLQLGVWYTDLTLGKQSLNDLFKKDKKYIDVSRLSIKGQDGLIFYVVNIKEFLARLNQKLKEELPHCQWYDGKSPYGWPAKIFNLKWEQLSNFDKSTQLTYDGFFGGFKDYLLNNEKLLPRENVVLMYDATLALFAGIQIHVAQGNAFSELTWGSIGWTSGASVGIGIAHRNKRVFVFVGDGGFQNCSTGPSSATREKLNPVYFIFQNNTYGIDQFLINPQVIKDNSYPEYNRLADWDYAKLAESFGAVGYVVKTIGELYVALDKVIPLTDKPAIISIQIPPTDIPQVLQ